MLSAVKVCTVSTNVQCHAADTVTMSTLHGREGGQEEFEVAEILTHKPQGIKKTDAKYTFLVRWEGYLIRQR